MGTTMEFSKPVVVDAGVAFCVMLSDGTRRVAIATKARLGTSDDAQGLAILAAFIKASGSIHAEAARLVQSGAPTPIYIGLH